MECDIYGEIIFAAMDFVYMERILSVIN